jgi:hypothetical protein
MATGNQRTASLPAFHEHDRFRQCGKNSIPPWKIPGDRRHAWCEFGNEQAVAGDPLMKIAILLRVRNIDPATQDRDRFPSCIQRSAMRRGIDAPCQTGDGGPALLGQTRGQARGQFFSGRGALARSNDPHRGFLNEGDFPANKEDLGNVVQTFQRLRPVRRPAHENANAPLLALPGDGSPQLLGSGQDRTQRIRDGRICTLRRLHQRPRAAPLLEHCPHSFGPQMI